MPSPVYPSSTTNQERKAIYHMTEMMTATHNAQQNVPTGSVINTVEVTAPATATEAPISLSISLPIAGYTLRSATNLFNLIYTWGSLISSATGGKFSADKYFINVINRRKFESIDELLAYAKTETEIHRVLTGVRITRDKMIFDGFHKVPNPENSGLYSRLVACMNGSAMRTKVIRAKVLSEVQTEQWQSFSKWLRRIGMTNEDRLALLDLLSENVTNIPPEVQTSQTEQASKQKQLAVRA